MKHQRSKFSLPIGGTYLNCAYMSPMMKSVEKAGVAGMKRKQNPTQISAQDFFTEAEKLRDDYAAFLQVRDSKRIAIIPSASYGLSTVARNLPLAKSERIVLVSEQFPSNVYPWQRLAAESGASLHMVEPPKSTDNRGKLWNERILEAITTGTKVVAMGNVHWADGTRFDLEKIGRTARDHGARLIIDGTQSVGALPFDIQKVKPDALICAGYKWLMGPYSIGLAYFGEAFDNGVPLEENWMNRHNSEDFAGLVQYESHYQPGALRYEVGEHSNFILVPMLREALRQVKAWGAANIQDYCKNLTREGVSELRENGFWVEDEAYRGYHLFGIRLPKGIPIERVKARVAARKIAVSFRGDSVRVSPHIYNTASDIGKLVDTLMKLRP
jgi:selenocysteine lyase/cysteine desulfurase